MSFCFIERRRKSELKIRPLTHQAKLDPSYQKAMFQQVSICPTAHLTNMRFYVSVQTQKMV